MPDDGLAASGARTAPPHRPVLIVRGADPGGLPVAQAFASSFPGRVAVTACSIGQRPSRLPPAFHVDPEVPGALSTALPGALEGVAVAVLAAPSRTDVDVARACLRRGVAVVALGAERTALGRLRTLAPLAEEAGVPLVVGAGVVPGLTGALAVRAAGTLGEVSRVDVAVLAGLSDARRLLGGDLALHEFSPGDLPRGVVRPFSGGRAFAFPGAPTRRRAYRAALSDQHVIPDLVGADRASSRIAFRSRLATAALVGLARSQAVRLWDRLPALVRDPARAFSSALVGRVGPAPFSVSVEVCGSHRGATEVRRSGAHGDDWVRADAAVAVAIVSAVLEGSVPGGAHEAGAVLARRATWERLGAASSSAMRIVSVGVSPPGLAA